MRFRSSRAVSTVLLVLSFGGLVAQANAAPPPSPGQSGNPGSAGPPAHTPPPPDHAKWDERTWREQQELLSDSAEEIGFNGPYGMPTDESGNPASPTTHRGDPVTGEYGTSRQRCVGDGISGERFYVYYGYPSSVTPDSTTDTRNYIRSKLGYANYYLWNSDATYVQDMRWLCNGGQIKISDLAVPNTDGSAATDITIDEIEAALRTVNGSSAVCRMGCSTHQMKSYVVMMDKTTNLPYCGLGWPGGAAKNNKSPSDTRSGVVADVRCWRGSTILEEIMHTQGSVLFSSPNSDGGHHCKGTADEMCGGYGSSEPCPSLPPSNVDCGHNGTGADSDGQMLEPAGQRFKEDYWDPSGGQYFLATNWNTADSLWFTRPALR